MRLAYDVSPAAFTVTVSCYACGRRVRLAATAADLDGPAFEAYYCRPLAGYSERDCRPYVWRNPYPETDPSKI